ncbi:hypothetical protein [Hoeflea ulvae]|uniref:Uncharacterized protein n=1 Tax=Hoeflea ulvae TaxID=2983764 RepID=A0ABT3YLY6_9HYPH|nr:hypothetical protein [Hoeflea ulvae]MCY0096916.1 hypothetical protein [Hoeflea ulvae]
MKYSPGDIVEIETGKGLAYVQVTHNHSSYPEVVRALRGTHASRPDDLQALARSQTDFSAMIALASAVEAGRITGSRIGSAAIPEEDAKFPTFRMPIRDKQGGIAYWWLWDGQGLSYETELTPEAEQFPMREVMAAETLLRRLAR